MTTRLDGDEEVARWRLLLAAVLVVVVLVIVVVASSVVSTRSVEQEQLRDLVNATLSLLGIGSVVWLIARRWLRVDPAALGLRVERRSARAWLVGVASGVGLGVAAFLIALSSGGYRIDAVAIAAAPAHLVVLGALATAIHALFEEVAFRVGLVGVLRLGFSPAVAVLTPSVLFGALHLNNEGASALGAVNVVVVGVLFGLLFLARRPPSLALVAGLHFGWNEALYRMGLPVSGTVHSAAFLSVEPSESSWSGGAFGLEASPATTLVLGAAVCFVAWRLRRPSRSA